MNITIDLVADAAAMLWGTRGKGMSHTVDVPGRGVRLFLSSTGDVVGVEVLGWSQRTADPAEVAVRVTGAAEIVDESDPLAQALAALSVGGPKVDFAGRPLDDSGQPMMNVKEASAVIGRERSWITRQLNAGALRGRKIGNEWWTTQEWAAAYIAAHTVKTVRRYKALKSAAPDLAQLAAIRAWAKAAGFDVSERGLIAAPVLAKYAASR